MTWRDLYWTQLHGINLPLVQYGDTEWVPLHALAKSLGIHPARLHKRALHHRPYEHIVAASLRVGKHHPLMVTRASLEDLVRRMVPGHNAQLLALLAHIKPIALGVQGGLAIEKLASGFLVRQQRAAAQLQKRQQLADLYSRYLVRLASEPFDTIAQDWVRETGKTRSTLLKAAKGQYSYAFTKYITPHAQYSAAHAPRRYSGPKPKLDAQTIVAMRQALRGKLLTRQTCAQKYQTQVTVVAEIEKGKYATAAMREALRLESQAASASLIAVACV